MTIRTAEQLRKNLENIQKHNQKQIDKVNAEFFERVNRDLDLTQVKQKLKQAETVAERSEALAKKALKAAEARELQQAEEIEETQKRVSADIEAKQKFRSERAWIAAGGDPKAFETHWPALREKLLEDAVIQNANAPKANQTLVRSL